MHIFNPDEHVFIVENVKGKSTEELTGLFNNRFDIHIGINQIRAYKKNHKLSSGLNGRFPKGHIPVNKGTNNGGWEPTQFKKGSIPVNRLPVGTERVDSKDGYIYVKIQDGHLNKNWKQKHILIWENQNGPIPKGHCLIFGDRNKLNFDIGNLICVSRKQLARLNQSGLIQNNIELTKTGIIIADIQSKIGDRKKRQGGI